MNESDRRPSAENPAEMYNQYFVPAMFAPWAKLLLEHAAPSPGEHVLDVACGTGVVARHVAPLVGSTGVVSALDINPAMLAVARTSSGGEWANITWQEGSALALPFPEDSFDLVLCQQGLQFFRDRGLALREMRRVLKPSGRVAISVNQSLQANPVYAALFQAIAHHLGTTIAEIASPFALGDAGELHALLASAGFKQIVVTPIVLTVRFPEPVRFVHLATLSSAAVVPVFAGKDVTARRAMIEAITSEMEPTVRAYIDGDTLAFPAAINIGFAHAS